MLRKKLRKIRVKYQVTKLEGVEEMKRPHTKTHVITEDMLNVKSVISEICGLAPYEKKACDLIKRDKEAKSKKFLRRRLGSLKRGKRKFEALLELTRQ